MPELNYYDLTVNNADEVDQQLVDIARLPTPELGALPSDIRKGDTFRTKVKKSTIDTDIFINHGEGVAAAKGDWKWVTNKAMPVLRMMEMDLPASAVENPEIVSTRWEETKGDEFYNLNKRLVQQMFLGRTLGETKGFRGLPDLKNVAVIDALDQQWNLKKTFTATDLNTAGANGSLASVWLLNVAPSPESQGLAWFWGGNRQLNLGPELIESATANGLSRPVKRQYIDGHVGLRNHTEYDVVEIKNVPTVYVKDFFISNVIARALSVYDNVNVDPNMIMMHVGTFNSWHLSMQNQNANSTQSGTLILPRDGQFSKMFGVMEPWGLPIVRSKHMPKTGSIS